MFKPGDIVFHDNLVFNDGKIDLKKYRPCVVLFSFEDKYGSFVCSCVLTSQVHSFNSHPDKYIFIPQVINYERKLSFANISNIIIHLASETHYFNFLRTSNIKEIVDKIIYKFECHENYEYMLEHCKGLKEILEYYKWQKEEDDRTNKLQKLEKKRNSNK